MNTCTYTVYINTGRTFRSNVPTCFPCFNFFTSTIFVDFCCICVDYLSILFLLLGQSLFYVLVCHCTGAVKIVLILILILIQILRPCSHCRQIWFAAQIWAWNLRKQLTFLFLLWFFYVALSRGSDRLRHDGNMMMNVPLACAVISTSVLIMFAVMQQAHQIWITQEVCI